MKQQSKNLYGEKFGRWTAIDDTPGFGIIPETYQTLSIYTYFVNTDGWEIG